MRFLKSAVLLFGLLALICSQGFASRSLRSVGPSSEFTIAIGGTTPPTTTSSTTNLCYKNEAEPVSVVYDDVDIFLLSDTTGSMSYTISGVKTNALSILADIKTTLPAAQFGVGEYRDEGDAFVFRLNQAITATDSEIQAGIDQWVASGGGDSKEAELYALQQIATTVTFRPSAQKFIVWFGDAAGHDPSMGVSLAQAKADLLAKGFKVLAIDVGTMNALGQALDIAIATGGSYSKTSGSIANDILAAIRTTVSRDITLKKPSVDCSLFDSTVISYSVGNPSGSSGWPVVVKRGEQVCFDVTFLSTGQCVALHDTCLVQLHTNLVDEAGKDTSDFVDIPIPPTTFKVTVGKKPTETYTVQTMMYDPCKFPYPKDNCPFYPYCGLDQFGPECKNPVLAAGCKCPPCPSVVVASSFAKTVVGPGVCSVSANSSVYASSISAKDFKTAGTEVASEIKSYCSDTASADISSTASKVANTLAKATATALIRYSQVISCSSCYKQPFFAAVNVSGVSKAVATAMATAYQEAFASVDNCGETWIAYALAKGEAFAQSTQIAVAKLYDDWKLAGGSAALCADVNVNSKVVQTAVAKALACTIVDVLATAYYDPAFPDYPTGFSGACSCSVTVAGTDANVPDSTTVCPRTCPSSQGAAEPASGADCRSCPPDLAALGGCAI